MKVFTLVALGAIFTASTLSPVPQQEGDQPHTGNGPNIQYVDAFTDDFPIGNVTMAQMPDGRVVSNPSPASNQLASWVCTVHASDAWKVSSTIYGDGWQGCSGTGYEQTALRVTLQRYAGLGIWNNRVQEDVGFSNSDWISKSISYNCSGTGTETYRILVDGWAVYGLYKETAQSSKYLIMTC
jgi:hypothetical protein